MSSLIKNVQSFFRTSHSFVPGSSFDSCHPYRRGQASTADKSIQPTAVFTWKQHPLVDETEHTVRPKIGVWNTLDEL